MGGWARGWGLVLGSRLGDGVSRSVVGGHGHSRGQVGSGEGKVKR